LFGYDKFKSEENFSSFETCLNTNIMFLALPTQYKHATKEYDKSAIFETCKRLTDARYDGIIVIKSTVEPETT
jgi:UDP-glucose 6-dehydrogenase